jgi:hypothetical protein
MAKSLIRKNQLHPDVGDLVSGYGSGYFVTFDDLEIILDEYNPEIELTGQNVVYTTGEQTISGVKAFDSRPTFNGSGLATTGEIGGGSTIFSGNRPITANVQGFLGVNPGGNDVVSFLNNVFYPFINGSIILNGFATQELGTTTISIPFIGTINTGSLNLNQFTNVEGYVNNVGRLPLLLPVVQNFNWSVGVNLNSTSNNVYIKATGVNQNNTPIQIQSNTQSIIFEAPYYWGSGQDNLTSAQITGAPRTKVVSSRPNPITLTYNTINSRFWLAYPSGWGPLTSIIDPNNFNITSSFTGSGMLLNLVNGSTHPYLVYKSLVNSTNSNFQIRFNF